MVPVAHVRGRPASDVGGAVAGRVLAEIDGCGRYFNSLKTCLSFPVCVRALRKRRGYSAGSRGPHRGILHEA